MHMMTIIITQNACMACMIAIMTIHIILIGHFLGMAQIGE